MNLFRFRMLDVAWSIRTDPPELAEDLARVFGLFLSTEQDAAGQKLRFEVMSSGKQPELKRPDGPNVPLLPSPWTFPHLHMLILTAVFERVENYLLVHAASVARHGRGIAVCGPSGFGKTTLALALCDRGWTVLSDEFAVLDRTTRTLLPFPRLPGSRTPYGSDWWSVPDLSGTKKWYPPVESFRSELAPSPVPLEAVFLLQSRESEVDGGLIVTLRGREGERAFRDAMKSAGAMLSPTVSEKGPVVWLQFEKAEAQAAMEICDAAQDAVVSVERIVSPPTRNDWSELPAVKPVPAARGPLEILRYLRNRGPKSALYRETGGDLGRMLLELAGLVSDVPVYTLKVGVLEEMVRCVCDLQPRRSDSEP